MTSRWAAFLNINQGFAQMDQATPAGPVRVSSGGSYDTLSYVRYTLYKVDKPKSTFRIAPLAGVFMPTGDNDLRGPAGLLPKAVQTGTGMLDPYVGVTMGYNSIRYGMNVDSTYRYNPRTDSGVSPGSQFRADAQFELKLVPWHMPEEGLPRLFILSIESNYVQDAKDRVSGLINANSGGKILRQDAVFEISSLRWQIGMGAQLPIMQDLDGVNRMKQRSGFYLFFECYLAAPTWRRARHHA